MRINIQLDLASPDVRSHLLEGLESWLKLGLLSEEQISELAAVLSEPLPVPRSEPPTVAEMIAQVRTEESSNQATRRRAVLWQSLLDCRFLEIN